MKQRLLNVLLLVALAFTASMVLTGRMRDANEAGAQNRGAQTPAVNAPGPVGTATTLTDFSAVAERTIPAVVNISAQQTVRQDFFDPRDFFFGRRGMRSQRGIANAVGSGVIVSTDGYILTNNHVVTGEADRGDLTIEKLDVSIALSDKRELPATLIGTDPATDLALLKVEAKGLPTMPWGDSSKLKVAEWVLAIGNPYQLSETVTLGIVSAVGRTNLGVSTFGTSCRPTPPSTRAIPAGPSSTRAASWWASTPSSSRAAVDIRASASPCRATWRARSSTTCGNTARSGAARSATCVSWR
jgi:serine protease Do